MALAGTRLRMGEQSYRRYRKTYYREMHYAGLETHILGYIWFTSSPDSIKDVLSDLKTPAAAEISFIYITIPKLFTFHMLYNTKLNRGVLKKDNL